MRILYFILFFFLTTQNIGIAQIGRLPLSPFQKIEQNIAKTKITIEYSRPSTKGRLIFGDLVPFTKYWRTGANQNTIIQFTEDVIIDSKRIKKGKYSIITKPDIKSWEFILYDETNNWDVPEEIDTVKIMSKTVVATKKLKDPVESLIISIGDFNNYKFDLDIKWETTHISVPIALTTKESMNNLIQNELGGPTSSDYYAASVYQLESEKNFDKGLVWIDQAIKNRPKPVWYDYRVKALLMIEKGNQENIQDVINIGLKLAQEINNSYGLSEFERIRDLMIK